MHFVFSFAACTKARVEKPVLVVKLAIMTWHLVVLQSYKYCVDVDVKVRQQLTYGVHCSNFVVS